MCINDNTIGRDLLPRIRRVHEGGVLDLIVDVLVLVERERAAQAHVHDHADAPHVERAVVPLVAQHFRSCMKRGNHVTFTRFAVWE